MNYALMIRLAWFGYADETDTIADYSAEIRRIAGF
jgi:hypothetical protein